MYIRNKKHKLQSDKNLQRLTKFFLQGYKSEKYYWEFVQMFRKFLIIVIMGIFRNEQQTVILALVFFIVLFLLLQIYHKPYETGLCNYLETISLFTCFITYFSLLYFSRVGNEDSQYIFIAAILMINIYFLIFWGKAYWKFLKDDIYNTFTNVKNTLIRQKSQNQKIIFPNMFKKTKKNRKL